MLILHLNWCGQFLSTTATDRYLSASSFMQKQLQMSSRQMLLFFSPSPLPPSSRHFCVFQNRQTKWLERLGLGNTYLSIYSFGRRLLIWHSCSIQKASTTADCPCECFQIEGLQQNRLNFERTWSFKNKNTSLPFFYCAYLIISVYIRLVFFKWQ